MLCELWVESIEISIGCNSMNGVFWILTAITFVTVVAAVVYPANEMKMSWLFDEWMHFENSIFQIANWLFDFIMNLCKKKKIEAKYLMKKKSKLPITEPCFVG